MGLMVDRHVTFHWSQTIALNVLNDVSSNNIRCEANGFNFRDLNCWRRKTGYEKQRTLRCRHW